MDASQILNILNNKIINIKGKIDSHKDTIRSYNFYNRILKLPSIILTSLSVPLSGLITAYSDNPIIKYIQNGTTTLLLILQILYTYNDYEKKIALHLNCVKVYSHILEHTETNIVTASQDIESIKTLYHELVNKLSVIDDQQELIISYDKEDKNIVKPMADIFHNTNILKKRVLTVIPRLTNIQHSINISDNNEEKDTISTPVSNITTLINKVDKIIEQEGITADSVDHAKDIIQNATGKQIAHFRNPSRDMINKLMETKDSLMSLKFKK